MSDRTSPEIRPARLGDARALAELHVGGWQWGYRGLLPETYLAALSIDAREPFWCARLADPSATDRTLVWCGAGSRPRGFIHFGLARVADAADAADAEGRLHALYLEEVFAGRGVGHALHDAAIAEMRAAGHGTAALWVLESNARACAFYARQGWAPDGRRRRDAFGDEHHDVIRMALPLAPR